MAKIDFDRELSRGIASFNGVLGRWWNAQAMDRAHKHAYRNIAEYVKASFVCAPRRIIDYACGAGNLLLQLALQFPRSRLIGLDGSSFLLDDARRRIARLGKKADSSIRLIETALPDFSLPQMRADLIIFAFPNMAPSPGEKRLWAAGGHLEPGDSAVARELSHIQNVEDDFEFKDPAADSFALLRNRLISLSLRRLIRCGGTCVRVEYATARRHELTKSELMRVAFAEGSLDMPVNGRQAKSWFRVLASSYFRSRVIEDVYQQTGDISDKKGGYLITTLRGI